MKISATVTLKKEVLDPQGKVVGQTLKNMGYKNIINVRQGKYFDIELEETDKEKAKKIIKMKGYVNSGMFFARKDSIIYSFARYQSSIFEYCVDSFSKSKVYGNVYYLYKPSFKKLKEISFDYAILEKSKNINGIKLNISLTDLGNWKEIWKYFKKTNSKKNIKKNTFYRPWGKYINLYSGKGFLLKELIINPKSSISLQKHNHRSEHWSISSGTAKITISNKKFTKKTGDTVFISKGSVHRIENPYKKPVKIIEVQTGPILKESDIVRYQDIYGRVR